MSCLSTEKCLCIEKDDAEVSENLARYKSENQNNYVGLIIIKNNYKIIIKNYNYVGYVSNWLLEYQNFLQHCLLFLSSFFISYIILIILV